MNAEEAEVTIVTESEAQVADAVRQVYRRVLGRDPDPAGLRLAVEHMRSGATTEDDIARGMMDSEEYKKKNAYKDKADAFRERAVRALLEGFFVDARAGRLF